MPGGSRASSRAASPVRLKKQGPRVTREAQLQGQLDARQEDCSLLNHKLEEAQAIIQEQAERIAELEGALVLQKRRFEQEQQAFEVAHRAEAAQLARGNWAHVQQLQRQIHAIRDAVTSHTTYLQATSPLKPPRWADPPEG